MDNLEVCIECGEPDYAVCHYCGDSLCEDHARAIPGYYTLKCCSDCFAKHEAPALAAITAFVAEAA